jgi:hypothetical protein
LKARHYCYSSFQAQKALTKLFHYSFIITQFKKIWQHAAVVTFIIQLFVVVFYSQTGVKLVLVVNNDKSIVTHAFHIIDINTKEHNKGTIVKKKRLN